MALASIRTRPHIARGASASPRWRSARLPSVARSRSTRRREREPRSGSRCRLTVTTRIRVLVADDHAVVRQGLRTFLELQDDIEVVADVADGRQALAAVDEHDPDVVLMDLVLPEVDGVEAIRRIVADKPRVR